MKKLYLKLPLKSQINLDMLLIKTRIGNFVLGNPVPIDIPKKFAVSVEELLEGVDLKKLHKAQVEF